MRIVKLIIISAIVLFVIVTIISLFIPSNIRLSKAIQIQASRESVLAEISNPSKWKEWYPNSDSSKFYYENGQVKGLILDANKQQVIAMTGVRTDEVNAVYRLPHKTIATGWQIASSETSNSVTVQWYIDFHLKWYPWEKFKSFVFEKVYNPQLQQGLDNLKAVLETKESGLMHQ